ncbi:MAG: hypothetical protein CMG60_02210 [Candidatus Marinimicrobia bacterium]|nr:hypothetical protein [Candidatus Neomarinimicrobiota bacterium]
MNKIFKKNSDSSSELFNYWSLSKKNYIIFFTGLIFIILGYIVMATGSVNSFQSLTLAPIMLFVGYIIIIPISILYRDNNVNKNKN